MPGVYNPLKTKKCPWPKPRYNAYIYTNKHIMNQRSEQLLALRPSIANARFNDQMSAEEHFQNKTLRPVIKLQNEILLASFQNYIIKGKNAFYELTLDRRLEYISNAVQKDMKFRNSLKGMIMGQFTLEEYNLYIQNSSALNKRMMNMVIKRIQDQLQYFEQPALINQ